MPLYAGFIDFKTDRVFGRRRSCFQDTIANIGSMFGHDLKDMIDKQIPPDTYTDTLWYDVMKNKHIIEFLRFETIKVEGRKGGPTVYVLKEFNKNGIYLVLKKSFQIIQNIKIGTHFSTMEISVRRKIVSSLVAYWIIEELHYCVPLKKMW